MHPIFEHLCASLGEHGLLPKQRDAKDDPTREVEASRRRERDAHAIRTTTDPNRPMRVFADAVWDPKLRRAVPDTVGTLVRPADYAYDPMRDPPE